MNTTENSRLKTIELLIVTFIWILLFAVPLLFGNFGFDGVINWNFVFRLWNQYLILFVVFAINHWILVPLLFFSGKRLPYFGALILLIVLLMLILAAILPDSVNHMGRGAFRPGPMGPRPRPLGLGREFISPHANMLITSILILGFDTGLRISIKWMQSEQQQIRLDKENTQNQLAFLRNQISPHFFLNTLNNIHALMDFNVEKAKKSVIDLSGLMAYLLYESDTDKISFKKEADFIENFMDLMALRVSEKVELKLTIDDGIPIPDISIPPLLFVSFIENAFKYGISYAQDSFVFIDFRMSGNFLHFEVKNSIVKKDSHTKQSGIGLTNSVKRLDLIYGDRYTLDLSENGDIYTVFLKIPL